MAAALEENDALVTVYRRLGAALVDGRQQPSHVADGVLAAAPNIARNK
jgi:hypothetical protein